MKVITGTIDIAPGAGFDSASVLFFDIETTGLKKENSQVYLAGCAFKAGGCWKTRQYLAESALDEREVVESFYGFAKGFKTLVHFNGRHFDVPFMDYKADMYNVDFRLADMDNFDIYTEAKPLKALLGLERMGQKNIESFLGIARDDEMGGGELISLYYEYERTGNEALERLLLLHNHDDVQGMLPLLKILDYLNILKGNYVFESFEEIAGTAVFNFRLPAPLLKAFENRKEGMVLAGDGTLLQLNVDILDTLAGYPLEDYKDYYYLTEEDRVIHKDVAEFVDKSRRRKAKKCECFVKIEDRFLPRGEGIFGPQFFSGPDFREPCFRYTQDICSDGMRLKAYADSLAKGVFAGKKSGSGAHRR